MPNISKTKLLSIKIPRPPYGLQKKYKKFLHEINNQNQKELESLKVNDLLFNSLVQRAFRGEL